MLENSIKPSLGDGQKREDERRKRKIQRNIRSRDYFYRLSSKEKKADFVWRSVFCKLILED
jgi:hypothetical protein